MRAIDKDKQVVSLSVLETMFVLKNLWDNVTEKTIQSCFRKAGITTQSQESAMDENDDCFKDVLCNDDDPIRDLEFGIYFIIYYNFI